MTHPLPELVATCDVLVIGSGAAGIAAALKAAHDGRNVIVIDKSRYLGGTSAISAGWAWVPGNRQGVREGDTRAEAKTYLKHLAGEALDSDKIEVFLDEVPRAMAFLEDEAGIPFHYPENAPDYQMEVPGAKVSGRAVTVGATDARILGDQRLRVQPYLSSYTVFGYMPEVGPDIARFLKANRDLRSFAYVARKLVRTWLETALYRRAYTRTNGNAMMTHMIAAAARLGVRLWTGTPASEIVTDAEGVVVGARLSGDHPGFVRARYGVILAAGGFSGDPGLRARYFAHDPVGDNHTTPTVGHDGDSVRLAQPLGGHVDATPHQPASWAPVTVFRGLRGQRRWFPHLRAFGMPGLIAVDRDGVRFANESLSYHDYGVEMLRNDAGRKGTYGWIIADDTAMRRYGIGYAKPWPFPQTYFRWTGYLRKAPTLAALAAEIDLPVAALQATVDEFNQGAVRGEDPRFGRGSTWFHHFKGDMEHEPNPNLAPLERGPFYAARIEMGDLGTYAGLAVNTRSEVLDAADEPISGLYAVGTAAVSIFGGGYPGYGANLGPALVFGYRAGRDVVAHAAERAGSVG